MRKIRVLVLMSAVALTTATPAVAQAQAEAPPWAGGGAVERLIDWFGGLWTVVAGSETDLVLPVDGDETVGEVPGGAGDGETLVNPLPETEVYPEFDPEG